MLKVTLRGIQGHLVRLLLTAAAVMLGVSFVTGTFVLRDSMNNSLGGLLSSAATGVDVSVRGAATDNGASGSAARQPVPLKIAESLAELPGVERVSPDLEGTAILQGRDGTPVRNSQAPGLGFAYTPDDSAWNLVRGHGPTTPGEVAVESATLKKADLKVGDTTAAVIGGRTSKVSIVGEVRFRSETLFGATAVLVDRETAQRLFAPDGLVRSISLTAATGVDQSQLRTAVAQVLPASLVAVTGATVAAENQDAIQEGLGFFTTFLLVFAGVALFVGAFIIVNTFSMLIGQRARELALLRALGSSKGQVLRLVLGEAAIVGVIGSALGILLGVLGAKGAKAAMSGLLGADIGSSLPVTWSTVLISLGIGTVVTVLAALLPARRASSTAPVAAMRGDAPVAQKGLRRRGLTGVALIAAGAGVLGAAVTRDSVPWVTAGLGALVAVLGMLVSAPWATGPVVRVISWPFVRVVGVIGRLARQNALRVPRRTAATASALMIGLSLVAGISVLASSVSASVNKGVHEQLTSDYALNGGTVPVPGAVAVAAASLRQVQSVAAISQLKVHIGGSDQTASAVSAKAVADNFIVSMRAGRLRDLGGDGVLVDRSTATAHGWHMGDVLPATVGALTDRDLTVTGIFEDSQAFGTHLIVDRELYRAAVPAMQQADIRVFVKATPGADLQVLRADLEDLVHPYLVVSVQNATEFADAQSGGIDTVLNLLYVLLLFSVVIAVLGIINTLALSVLERTREIGLLRAIGLRRRQLSGMITVEAVATAVFGAVLGTVLGVGLGVALQHGLVSQGLTALGIPWGLILVMLVASMVVGVLAAVAPSIRAARLNILQAIAGA
jgi:putative ABC transport system permease protein